MCYVIIRLPDGRYVGSPTSTRTPNPNLAASWREGDPAARSLAARLGGEVVEHGAVHASWVLAGRPQ